MRGRSVSFRSQGGRGQDRRGRATWTSQGTSPRPCREVTRDLPQPVRLRGTASGNRRRPVSASGARRRTARRKTPMRHRVRWRHAVEARPIRWLSAAPLVALLAILAAFVMPGDLSRVATAIDFGDLHSDTPFHDTREPLWIVRRADGGLRVLFDADTRTGCPMPFHTVASWATQYEGAPGWAAEAPGGVFRDGRLGSTYDLDGRGIFGPAPRDLTRVAFEESGGRVVVTEQALDEAIRSYPPSLPMPDCKFAR